ncbi:MAG: site-2 protease family protein [Candidatus Margulisiibacteriota bacterium]
MLHSLESAVILIPVILIVIAVHEFAHAKVADVLGDPTARYAGRLTLNPIKHLDPIGFLMLLVAGFGWATPVPVNPYNFANPRRGILYVSLAGPLSNFFCAWVVGTILRLVPAAVWWGLPAHFYFLKMALDYFVWISLALGVFNLIPVPPLDGFKILENLLPPSAYHIAENLNRYGFLLLIVVILGFQPVLSAIISLLFKLLTGS